MATYDVGAASAQNAHVTPTRRAVPYSCLLRFTTEAAKKSMKKAMLAVIVVPKVSA